MAFANIENYKFFYKAVRSNPPLLQVDPNTGLVFNSQTNKWVGAPGSKDGYKRISVYASDGAPRSCNIHAVVYMYVHGLILDPTAEINHKDGVKSNNRITNLELVTHKYNIQHAIDTGLKSVAKGERVHQAKLTSKAVATSRVDYAKKHRSIPDIARSEGVHPDTVRDFLRGATWKHVRMPVLCLKRYLKEECKNRHSRRAVRVHALILALRSDPAALQMRKPRIVDYSVGRRAHNLDSQGFPCA